MEILLTILHIMFCTFLILVILIQTGKGGGMGAAFGGGGGGSAVFGPRGAGSFIGKMTGVVAALFMLTSITLAYVSSSQGTGLSEKAEALKEMNTGAAGEDVKFDESTPLANEKPIEGLPVELSAITKDAGTLTTTDAGVQPTENAPEAAPLADKALQAAPQAAPQAEPEEASVPEAAPLADKAPQAEPEAAPVPEATPLADKPVQNNDVKPSTN